MLYVKLITHISIFFRVPAIGIYNAMSGPSILFEFKSTTCDDCVSSICKVLHYAVGKSNPRIIRIFIFFRVPAIGISNAMMGTAHCSAQQHTAAHKRRSAHSAQHTAAKSSAEHTQHVLSTIVSEAEARRVVGLINAMDNPQLPRHMELHHSDCGDATTLAMLPTDAATTLPNPSFTGGIARRLLLSTHQVLRSERRRCLACHKSSTREHSADEPGRSVDEFGDHITGCKHMLPLRTTDLTRSTLTPLHPAALASVPYGIVLVRVRSAPNFGTIHLCRCGISLRRCRASRAGARSQILWLTRTSAPTWSSTRACTTSSPTCEPSPVATSATAALRL